MIMLRRLIFLLIRLKLGVRKYQNFRFKNQEGYYFIGEYVMVEMKDGVFQEPHITINDLITYEGKIIKL